MLDQLQFGGYVKGSLEDIFIQHSGKVYAGLRGRHAAKYRHGKLIRPNIPLPFTLAQFRVWVLEQFGLHHDRPIRCYYCRGWMDIGSYSLDHKEPWRRTCDSSFENLCLCCESCNLTKGDFSEQFYVALLTVLDAMTANNVASRDEIAKLMSLVRMGWGYQRVAFATTKTKDWTGRPYRRVVGGPL